MFCPKCGKPVGEAACFCANCGNAIVRNTSRPATQGEYMQIKDGVSIFYPNGHNEIGYVLITTTEIIVYKKSKFVMLAFGMIGTMLDEGQEAMRIRISEIANGYKERFRLNKNAYYLNMKNGDTYIMCFDKHKTTIPYLDSLIGRR